MAMEGMPGMEAMPGMEGAMEDAKPQCGSGGPVGEYDLPLHVGGLFLVLLFSILGAAFPVVAKKVSWVRVPDGVFFATKHFGTGVLVATAFVHLLPVAFASLNDPCLPDLFTDDYPALPGVIMMAAMFSLFVVEMWLHGKTGGHSHGGPTGVVTGPNAVTSNMGGVNRRSIMMLAPPARPPRADRVSFETDEIEFEKKMAQKMYEERMRQQGENPFMAESELPPSEMPPWFIVFYEQYVRQRMEMVNMIKNNDDPRLNNNYVTDEKRQQIAKVTDSPFIDSEGQMVDPAVYRKMSLNITLLEGGILFHSIFVGMTVSITIEGYLILLIAILFHQMFEGLGLGSRIAEVPYPKGSIRPWVLVMAFGTTAPIGMGIGIAANNTYDPNSAAGLIIVGVFNAISSGLLLWAALVDLLAEDFLSENAHAVMTGSMKRKAFIWVLLGAAAMSVVGIFA